MSTKPPAPEPAPPRSRTERDFTDLALDAQLDTFFLFDPRTSRALRWNRAFREISGYGDEEIAALPAPETYYSPEDLQRAEAFLAELLAEGTGTIELELICKDGRRVPTEYKVSVIRDARGEPEAVISVGRDITEHRRLEQRLAMINHAIDSSLNAFDVIGEDGTFRYVNQAYVKMWGYDSPEEILGTSPAGHCADPAQPRRIIEALQRTGQYVGEFLARRKDGSTFEVLMHAKADRDEQGEIIYPGSSIDVTERRRAERSLEESERRLATLMRNLPGMAYRCDNGRDRRMSYLSEGAQRVTGYSASALLGGTDPSYGALIHPEDAEVVWASVRAAIEAQGSFQVEYRIRDRAGGLRWVSEQGRIVDGPGAEGVTLEGYVTDISQLRSLETQLQQAQKMEAVGRLAGGVAHDFNNLLTVINNCCEFLLEDIPPAAPSRADVEAIQQAASKATTLTQQLLAFSRKQLIRPQALDVEERIVHAQAILRRLIGEDVQLRILAEASPSTVWFDPGQLDQVLFNLAVNSRDAMPTGGQLTLETRGPGPCPSLPGEFVQLTVRDTGHGMDEATAQLAFEPFFTTKGVGQGTGLGLSTVYGIVKQHGGAIEVDSTPDVGTAVHVYMPTSTPSELGSVEVATPALPRGSESVLIVEDEGPVRDIARRILERLGYRVLTAERPADATALAGRPEVRIDLALADVVMPGTSGVECARRLREARPGLPVLFMSGHSRDAIAHHGVVDPEVAFVHKPFSAHELAVRVREALDKAKG